MKGDGTGFLEGRQGIAGTVWSNHLPVALNPACTTHSRDGSPPVRTVQSLFSTIPLTTLHRIRTEIKHG